MQTPNEEQLNKALDLSKEKKKLTKELESLQSKLTNIDAEIVAVLSGEKKVATPKPKVAAKAPKVPAKSAKAPKAPKASKPAKAAKAPKAKMKDKIITALKAAGPEGLSIQDLAKKVGKEPKHLSVWFSTTGANVTEIAKISRGTYGYKAPAASTEPEAASKSDAAKD